MNNLKHIFFDLDHTLWDFDRNSALAFDRVFQTFQVPIALPNFLEVYEPVNFAYWKDFREERVTKEQLRRGRLIDSFKKLNTNYPLQVIDKMAEAYIDELPINNYLLEGAVEILDYLSDRYALHIITNGFAEVQSIKLQNSNISPYFDTVTSSEEVGVKKPHSKVFQTALSKAKAEPKESMMIGDTFEADILGAEKVGMHTLFYNYRKEEIPSNYLRVNSLIEIKRHI
jgi:putative hydrolase of the HAD superfamily